MSLLPAIVRVEPRHLDWCPFCHREKAIATCDWGRTEDKTCNKTVCKECAMTPGANIHFCPDCIKGSNEPELVAA